MLNGINAKMRFLAQTTDKISNKLAGDIACLGSSMVEHQPRLLGFRVRFPAGAFAIFSVSAKAPLPISLSFSPFPFSFPFLFLFLSFSLRPFVCEESMLAHNGTHIYVSTHIRCHTSVTHNNLHERTHIRTQ